MTHPTFFHLPLIIVGLIAAAINPAAQNSCTGLLFVKINNNEAFIMTGLPASDQNLANYFVATGNYTCAYSERVCEFYMDSNGVIRQCGKGDYQPE